MERCLLVHCHPNMEKKLVAFNKFARMSQDQDLVRLQKLIRSIAHQHEDEKGGMMARMGHNLQLWHKLFLDKKGRIEKS